MATATVPDRMTTEALVALPENGTERWLIRGELREKPMAVRNRFHSKTMAMITTRLTVWRDAQPEPRGDVLCGEAGVRLAHNPDTTFGVDIAYVSAEVVARQTDDITVIDGIPTLAVEILSPNDTVEEIDEKITAYLAAGVPLVWIINPYRRTVTIYRPDAEPQLVSVSQELSGEPALPGFRVKVADLFA